MENYELLLSGITLVPIVGVVVLLIWRKATKKQAATIGILSETFALIVPLVLLSVLRKQDQVVFSLPWIRNMGISFRLSLNWLSLVFMMTEILVTLAAMIYSLGEKTGEKHSNYYYALLLLFSLGMSGTTLADDAFLFYIAFIYFNKIHIILVMIPVS